jgi:large subunit ribosomal protein L44e
MKFPKTMRKYCPFCKKHTAHRVLRVKGKPGRSLSRGSKYRARDRGQARGFGNHGRYSKPAINQRKRAGVKLAKKIDLRLECSVCKKKHVFNSTFRAKKFEFA